MSKKDQICQVYLAGPFFNEEQIERIEKVEKILAQNPTVKSFFSPRQEDQYLPQEVGSEAWVQQIYRRNEEHIKSCHVVLALIDFQGRHVDSGTAYEVGFAAAHGKPIIVFQEKDYPVNMMITTTTKYYCKTFEDLKNYDFVNLPARKYQGKVF